jgi:hypothetical protein
MRLRPRHLDARLIAHDIGDVPVRAPSLSLGAPVRDARRRVGVRHAR